MCAYHLENLARSERGPPEDAEIADAIQHLRESAAGDDEVTIGMIKAAGENVKSQIYMLVRKQWVTEPVDWEPSAVRGVASLLWKQKGSRADLDNYRGICLLSIVSRILARVAAQRLPVWSERAGWMIEDAFGFRPYRSTRDAILILQSVFEEAARTGHAPSDHSVAFLFVDIKKAYPNVPRFWCLDILQRLGYECWNGCMAPRSMSSGPAKVIRRLTH